MMFLLAYIALFLAPFAAATASDQFKLKVKEDASRTSLHTLQSGKLIIRMLLDMPRTSYQHRQSPWSTFQFSIRIRTQLRSIGKCLLRMSSFELTSRTGKGSWLNASPLPANHHLMSHTPWNTRAPSVTVPDTMWS